jgi:uncharacterized protein YfaS (alpha-2-macroglobulin family)
MFKYLLPLLFFSLLGANTVVVQSISSLDKPFMLKSSHSIFDESLSYTHKALLDCSPKLNAVYKIVSDKELKVIPTVPLEASSSYRCSYKKEKFSFKSLAFNIEEYHYFKDEKILRLRFNDEIKMETVSTAIQLKKIDKLSKTNLKYSIVQSSDKVLLLKINEHVGNKSIQLVINKKLKTTHGHTLDKVFIKELNRSTKKFSLNNNKKSMIISDAPQMVALEDGGFALRIFLNDGLEKKPEDFIEIEGVDNFTVKGYKYMNYYMRERLSVSSNSYYYNDVISSEFKPNTSYKVTLKKGLESYRQLKSDKHYTLKTGDRAKSIFFTDKKTYISNHGELGFSSVNVEKATLIVERLLDDNLRYFMNFSLGDKKYTDGYSEEIFTKELLLDSEKNKILKQKFLLTDLSKKQLPFGVYKITLRYSEKVGDKIEEKSSSKVLFVSDLGISVNLSKEQAFISILSLSKATPIEGAKVFLYGANNAFIAEAKSNSDGIAIITKSELLDKKVKGIVVRTAKDKNFLALNDTISSPSPKDILKTPERFKAHIYFQSNIVRPASKIHALITVKDRDFISANALPIKLELEDSSGRKMVKKVYHTNGYGMIDFSYLLENSDKIGDYYLHVFIGKVEIGVKSIKVEAFLPPKIENTLKTNKEIYQKSEIIELNVSSRYLFGTPSSNLNGKVTFDARPLDFYSKAYKNYSFSNRELIQENIQTYLNYSENIRLDSKGKYSMVLSTNMHQKVPSILEAMIGVTIMDDAQPVSNYKRVKIYPYRAMVGLKINRDSFEKGEALEGKAVLIDPISNQPIERTLYAEIKEIKWHYDYSEGNYNWEKEMRTVEHFTIRSNETFSRKIATNGEYILEVSDRLGGHSASSSFDVWWWEYSNISPKNDLKSIEIKCKDKLYKKGDSIEVQIKSPILEGQLLLTLEGKKVESYKMLALHKGVAKVSIPIDVEMGRGLRLHATAFRASDTPSNLIPFRAMGYKFIQADRTAHKIKISTNIPTVYKSNSILNFTVKTDKPAKVLVSIVDRGILQLVEQGRPEIFDYFNEKPLKAIAYYDLYDQLLSYLTTGKLVDFGAGGILGRKQKHLAPDFGKRVKPFMLWSGIVDVSRQEKGIDITIPEFNGRASVVVVAMNSDSVGVHEQELTIRDDIMLKPSYPLYALAGDTLEVPLRIFNTTNESKTVNLSRKLSDNLEFTLNEKSITVPANSSVVVPSKLYAHHVGRGKITIYAQYDSEKISKSVELPIYSPYSISTKTFKGISNKRLTFKAPKEYRDAKVLITLSDNLIGALRDDLKYLVEYPYGCAEQTSSKISAMHYAKPFLKKDRLVGESKNFIRQGIKKLYSMQNYYGEISYWRDGGSVHPYASLYASQVLLELNRDGVDVPLDLLKNTIKMLKGVATKNGSYSATYSNFHRLYAGFILAEENELSESTANMLYEKGIYKGHFLATFYMSAIRKMQGKVKSGEALFAQNSYELSRYAYKTYGNRTGNFESNVRDMLLHFLIKTQYFNKSSKDLLAVQKEFKNLYSTQSKAIALKAISLYLGKPKSSKLDVDVALNEEKANYTSPKTITVDKLTSPSIQLSTNSGAMSYSIELIKHLPRKIKNRLSTTKELSIQREFIDENGDEVDLNNLVQGDKLYSKVAIVNYGAIKNVVVNQRIPACLSIVNNNINNKEALFKNKNIHQEYREIRDDRVLNFINLRKKEEYNKSLKKYVNIGNRGVLYTPLIATSIGECNLPAVITEAMYDTRINDYAKGAEKVVVKALTSKESKIKQIVSSKKESFLERAKALVKKLYTLEMNSNNELEFSEFFQYPLTQYYRTKDASKEEVLKDKKSYFKDWSKRIYNNMKIEVIKHSAHKAEVKIEFDYIINNGKKVLKGESKHFLTVEEDKNAKVFISRVGLNPSI